MRIKNIFLSSSCVLRRYATAAKRNDDKIETLFYDKRVQKLLQSLNGLDISTIYMDRRMKTPERSHYALMNDNMIEELKSKMERRAQRFYQPVPFKLPRESQPTILSHDKELNCLDSSKFVFTDISYYTTDQDRTVVVREPNGLLRTATPEEHDRMNRIYFDKPDRPVTEPPVFSSPHFENGLKSGQHEFIMDWACYYFEPDDPRFIELSQNVFNYTVENKQMHLLYSTRHFASLVFYLVINENILPLISFFLEQKTIKNAADVIRLYKIIYPDWKTSISSTDSDFKIAEFYINNSVQNELAFELRNLLSKCHDAR